MLGGKCEMEKKMRTECAGNLVDELKEIETIIKKSDNVGVQSTSTANCNGFLTIYCC